MCHTLLQMDEPVRYAMILYTVTAVFLNITGSAAALTGIISSMVSYWKGASHRLALGSYLLLILGKSTRQGDCQARAAAHQIQFVCGLADAQFLQPAAIYNL